MRVTWSKRRRKAALASGALLGLVVAGAVVAATGDGAPRGRVASSGRASAVAEDGKAVADAPNASSTQGAASVATAPGAAQPLPPTGTGTGTVGPTGPKIVRNGDLSVRVGKGRFGAAFDQVATIAEANGGYVTSSTTSTGSSRARSGQLTVRVPFDRFDATRQALGRLGTVEQESLRGEDVSGQLVDYDARLRSLQAQEDALQALLGKAANVGEVMQVQNSLFSVRQQTEQLQAQRAQLDQSATLATIQVSLYEPGASPVEQPEPVAATGLARSLERARDGVVAVVGGMIVVLGWLVPVAVLAGLVWLGARLRRRSGRTAPAPAAAAATAAEV
jgi:hypothetical protein